MKQKNTRENKLIKWTAMKPDENVSHWRFSGKKSSGSSAFYVELWQLLKDEFMSMFHKLIHKSKKKAIWHNSDISVIESVCCHMS